MNKAQKERLAELKRQKQEIEGYKDQHREEFGPTADDMLSFLHDMIHDRGLIEFYTARIQDTDEVHIGSDIGPLGTDLWDHLKLAMEKEGK